MTPARRPLVRTSIAQVAVVTLALVLGLAPVAVADEAAPAPTTAQAAETPESPETDAPADQASVPTSPVDDTTTVESDPAPAPTPAAEPEPPVEEPEAPADDLLPPVLLDQVTADADRSTSAAEEPVLGRQQIRVGVRLAPGAYVRPGATLSGNTINVQITGGTQGFRVVPSTTGPEGAAGAPTYCVGPDGNPLVIDLAPGEDATAYPREFTGLTLADFPPRVEPCEATGDGDTCLVDGAIRSTDLIAPLTTEAPRAFGDRFVADHDADTVLDVLANDGVPEDPATSLSVLEGPRHGSVVVVTDPDDGSLAFVYTPDDGFAGRDTLLYRVSNSGGRDSNLAIIDVKDADGNVIPVYTQQYVLISLGPAEGSFVAPGATTAGSEFQLTQTDLDGTSTVSTCTTTTDFGAASVCFLQEQLPAGTTLSVVQKTAAEGFVKDPDTEVVLPCPDTEPCQGEFNFVRFTNASLPPTTAPDSATTTQGRAVTIDVLANDDSADPDTDLAVASDPDDGSAVVVGRAAPAPEPPPVGGSTAGAVTFAGTLAVRYTPRAGFTGTDTFEYALSSSNGTTTETVTVRVRGGVVQGTDTGADGDTGDVAGSSTGTRDGDTDGLLPDTGGPGPALLGLGGLLVAAGAGVVGRARRGSAGA